MIDKYKEALKVMCDGCIEGSKYSCDGYNMACCSYRLFYNLIETYFNPQPYKFEELKRQMLVYDEYTNEVIEIFSIYNDYAFGAFRIGWNAPEKYNYEPDRFYPLRKAEL